MPRARLRPPRTTLLPSPAHSAARPHHRAACTRALRVCALLARCLLGPAPPSCTAPPRIARAPAQSGRGRIKPPVRLRLCVRHHLPRHTTPGHHRGLLLLPAAAASARRRDFTPAEVAQGGGYVSELPRPCYADAPMAPSSAERTVQGCGRGGARSLDARARARGGLRAGAVPRAGAGARGIQLRDNCCAAAVLRRPPGSGIQAGLPADVGAARAHTLPLRRK